MSVATKKPTKTALEVQVSLDLERQVAPIDPRVFGGFLEHIGRAIYGGIYDPESPHSDAHGFRRDVLEALRNLHVPVVRYPGGNFVSAYDWRDGVGPRSQRRARPDFAWKSIESNQFGTDEFLQWCEALNTQPYLVVNLGTGSAKDAADLVEYCNLPGGTYWSDQRQANGRRHPYGVKLWGLGNEMDGPWQAGHVPATEYAQRAYTASQLMKGLDPAIQVVAAGSTARIMPTYMEWDRVVLERCWDYVDYISAHSYSRNVPDDSPAFLAEGVVLDQILDDYAGLLRYVAAVKKKPKNVFVAFDEWNVWYKAQPDKLEWWAKAPALIEEVYNLEDALVAAQYLNAFIRHADIVKIACIAQLVNVIAPILTKRDGILIQSTYYPLQLYATHARGVALESLVVVPEIPAGSRGEAPATDVAATYDAELRRVALFCVNRSLKEPARLSCRVRGASAPAGIIEAAALSGNDPKAANSWEQPHLLRLEEIALTLDEGILRTTLPRLSVAVIVLELDT